MKWWTLEQKLSEITIDRTKIVKINLLQQKLLKEIVRTNVKRNL